MRPGSVSEPPRERRMKYMITVANPTESRMLPPLRPKTAYVTSPPASEPSTPTRIVCGIVNGSRPGSASLASAPTKSPPSMRTIRKARKLTAHGPYPVRGSGERRFSREPPQDQRSGKAVEVAAGRDPADVGAAGIEAVGDPAVPADPETANRRRDARNDLDRRDAVGVGHRATGASSGFDHLRDGPVAHALSEHFVGNVVPGTCARLPRGPLSYVDFRPGPSLIAVAVRVLDGRICRIELREADELAPVEARRRCRQVAPVELVHPGRERSPGSESELEPIACAPRVRAQA